MDIVTWTFAHLQSSHEEPAYIDASYPTRYLSANRVRTLVRKLIAGFTHNGLSRGDCACVVSFNDINYTALYLGIIGAGGCFTGSNPGYTARELVHHLTITGAKFLLIESRMIDVSIIAARECGIPITNIFILDFQGEATLDGYQSWNNLLNYGEADWVQVKSPTTTPAAYLMTSGTTGFPKAAIITHDYLISQGTIAEETTIRDDKDTYLISVPAFHAFTIPIQHVLPLRQQNKAIYILPRFNESAVIDAIPKFGITSMVAVPPILIGLSKHSESKFKSITKIFVAGCSLPFGVQEQLHAMLPAAARIIQVYGMTEVGWATAGSRIERDMTGSIGQPLSGLELRIVDEDGNVLSTPEAQGEIQIYNPNAMKGYLHNEEATDEAFTPDHWIRSGDTGYVKDQKWYIVDRVKDLFKVRGWQVSPAEIEAALLEHPDILDAGVIGVPSIDGCGESPLAFTVLKRESSLDEDGIKLFLVPRLARYKHISEFKFVDKIPRSPTGKILRRELREMRNLGSISNTKTLGHGHAIVQQPQHPVEVPNPDRFEYEDLDFTAAKYWNIDKERILRGPYEYATSFSGKDFRAQVIAAFNVWLEVPSASLDIITTVVGMLHESSLLVDDVQDSSQLRRGFPVAHSIFGVAQTINSANYICFVALQELQKLKNPKATSIYAEELVNVHRGQGADLHWRDTLNCPTENDYLEMVGNKTGGLFRLGVKLMQGESSTSINCIALVNLMSLIFQIRNDYINLSSSAYSHNKGEFEDLTEGKFSFPMIHSVRSDPANLQLINILKQKTSDLQVKRYAVSYMESKGSFEYTRKVLNVLIERARRCAETIDQGQNKGKGIQEILDRMVVS